MPEPGPATILRARVTETAAGTLTEQAVSTPVDPRQNVAMLIHKVYLLPDQVVPTLPGNPAPDSVTMTRFVTTVALTTRNGLSAMPQPHDPGLIARSQRIGALVLNSAPVDSGVGAGYTEYVLDQQFDFPGGVLVADSSLGLYVHSANQTGGQIGWVIIYYELVQVSSQLFFAALSALETLS